jgi:uncharacterized membrane-anchored protein
MNKKKFFLIIGAFWIVLIGGFIGFKEFTLKTGNEILLKTVPVDPRDLFRGDYVILRYEITAIDTNTFSLSAPDFKIDDKIYATLDVGNDRIGNIVGISKQPPQSGNFIKGTVKSAYGSSITVEYGIESYFVPEGKGREIERNRGKIYTKVAIDKFGNAVIKSLIMDGKEVNLN